MRVVEIFHTIQGEGIDTGIRTVFVRTAGCDLDCVWCDTDYAKPMDAGADMTVERALATVGAFGTKHVCITGGEPLIQPDMGAFVEALIGKGYVVSVTTNGAQDVSKLPRLDKVAIHMDVKCPSSGMDGRTLRGNLVFLKATDQLKFVIMDRKDYEYARKFLGSERPKCNIVFQPVWGSDASVLTDWVLEDRLDVRVMLQTHKHIWGGERAK